MSENIAVSLIVPVWNPGEGVKKCIESLRSQTLTNIEIIFVDDRGSDASMEAIRAAAELDSRIKILVNPENSGPGYSRNAGIEASRGEYLGFIDPDDYVAPEDYLASMGLFVMRRVFLMEQGKECVAPRRYRLVEEG